MQAIPALDRLYPELTQVQMQQALMHLFNGSDGGKFAQLPIAQPNNNWADSSGQAEWELCKSADLNSWILQNLDNDEQRWAIVNALTAIAQPFGWASTRVVRSLGDRYAANVS